MREPYRKSEARVVLNINDGEQAPENRTREYHRHEGMQKRTGSPQNTGHVLEESPTHILRNLLEQK